MQLGKNLNKSFSCVYLRNLPDATKRRSSFEATANSIGLKYKKIKAINGYEYVSENYEIKYEPHLYPYPANQYFMGNVYTFMYVILDAMANNYESIVSCDDDVIFNDVEIDFIKPNLPDNWDIIILGRIDKIEETDTTNSLRFDYMPGYKEIAGSQCVAIHRRAYSKLMDELLSINVNGLFGDRLYNHLIEEKKANIYLMYPDVTYQDRETLIPYTIA